MRRKFQCSVCGGPVCAGTAYKKGKCIKCLRAEQRAEKERRLKEWDKHCVWCGKKIKFTYNTNVRTCSRRCQMYLMQSKRKETKEHLEERLVAYISQQDHYVKLAELREHFHISDKLLYTRGISCPELNFRAGKLAYLLDHTLSKKEVEDKYAEILRRDPSLTMNEVSKLIHVSVKRMNRLGISAGDIRRRYGILGTNQRTREQLQDMIVGWLSKQPCYRNAQDVCQALGIDYKCSLQAKGLDIVELNRLAGHSRPPTSYFEEHTCLLLTAAGIRVERQKTFSDCRDKNLLRFDFWLIDYGVLIEIQGAHHYNDKYRNYEKVDKHDKIKKDFAKRRNIPLYCVDTTPSATFAERIEDLIKEVKGAAKVTSFVHTASNCREPLTSDVEGNLQPSYTQGSLF